ncbi:TPA: TetR/AcrR family transcriptional regulator [Pseudomonas aeruginosa]|uniref:TetR/AcrR family transcriptional regulator n=1 Tax=Pseudomonas aeruginosa TaxID=287 RepID=UPI0005129F2D|nr:TetR/AcrR family transcriptional regulator [Pseudomonas aeruginosa]KHE57321.1 TetR family transcriptional regulator [Pseudomonas aeruginosa]KSP86063.1 TetR family transcriptional regulator [Pseudomonas aeruginosa]MBX6718746.1 TetR/AcrR family transcriptional regulator [Pseudomonas aeruginosa]MBX6874742.1 TetR/AcrR family transcriptional regulator [Pseudomonas aeruginosa]WNZ18770.1 helix-turn-helix domain-containing protein [Pseudomonas aeruginosa]
MQTTTSPAAPAKKLATRQRLLDAAVASLIELGVARTTTLEVQRRSGASRGALLHHFPSHAALLSATIEELVRRNDAAVCQAEAGLMEIANPLERSIRTLASMTLQPAFLAEIELWAAARTDPDLQAAIRSAERDARGERERVIAKLFSAVSSHPNFECVMALSVEFLRGMALSSVLTTNPEHTEKLIGQWLWAAETLLQPPRPD